MLDTPVLPPLLYKPRHERQEMVAEAWGKTRLLVCSGKAGSGKTHAVVYHALRNLMDRKVEKVLIGRPAVTVDEEHGYLPGDMEAKLGPWLLAMKDVVGDKAWMACRALLNIEAVAVGMSRGRTVKKAVMLIEESQNLTRQQLRMLATRVGSGGKLVLCGDAEQSDLRGEVPLVSFCERMRTVKGFKEIRFLPEDVSSCRGQFCADAGEALSGW